MSKVITRYFKCNELVNELLETLPSINILQVYPDLKNNKCFFEMSNSKESKYFEREGKIKYESNQEKFSNELLNSPYKVYRTRYFLEDTIKFDKFLNGIIRLKIMYDEKEDNTVIPEFLRKYIENEVTGVKEYYSIYFLKKQ